MRLPGVRRIVAVASGKGGVGKTTLAVHLAIALNQAKLKVGLFDADLYGPNVPLMLGIKRKRSATGFVPVARGERAAYIKPVERLGLKTMSVGYLVADSEALSPDPRFAGQIVRQTLVDVLWSELDLLLIDFPPGTGEPHHTLLNQIQIDGAVVVSTPQALARQDTRRSIDHFEQHQIQVLAQVENFSYHRCPHCGEKTVLFHREDSGAGSERQLPMPTIQLPLEPALSQPLNLDHPLLSDRPTEGTELIRQAASVLISQLSL
jgi:ATP-binding protein involved in chromosome partitioning